MSRKDTLRAILNREQLPHGNPSDHLSNAVPHIRAGAVGAMGRSLGQIANAAEQARALMASGQSIVEIPTENIDSSFVSDRFNDNDENHKALVEAIKERGQQVPILVRPHPEKADRFQIAYGHRRVRALSELGRSVRAVVRQMSDEDLVIAQGQENSARTDLSYFERGRFALALSDRGFDRSVIMSALNMEKTQLSRLMAIARAVPPKIAEAIGPAPKAGRPRWASFVKLLEQSKSKAALKQLVASERFATADSDTRFNLVLDALTPKAEKSQKSDWRDDDGSKVATVIRADAKLSVVIDTKRFPEFGEFIAGQLPDLYRAFKAQKE